MDSLLLVPPLPSGVRRRTWVVAAVLVTLLTGVIVVGVDNAPSESSLHEAWVSDTPRDNEVNHHAVGVGPDDEVIVAPIAAVPGGGATITDDSCALARLDPAGGRVRWQAGMPAENCSTHALTQPTIADIDGDEAPEVIVASTEAALIVRDAGTGDEEWRVGLPTYGYGRPTIASMNTAPTVVASDIQGGVVAARDNGAVAWRFDAAGRLDRPTVTDAPRVADFDDDGRPEIALGSSEGAVVLSGRGDVEWSTDAEATYLASAPADDAFALFAAGTGTIRAFDGATGETVWTRSIPAGRIRTATDGDGDGAVELYVGRSGEILALEGMSGETEWTTTLSPDDGMIVPPPVTADVTGDGDAEVIAVTNGGTVAVLDAESGAELARYERSVRIWTFATPADLDDDRRAEILVRYGDGRVIALDYAD